MIEETISSLTGDRVTEPEKSPVLSTSSEREEEEGTQNDTISSETIAFLFDEKSPTEPVKENKTPVKINLKSGFQKLSVRVHVPLISSLVDQELEVFKPAESPEFFQEDLTEPNEPPEFFHDQIETSSKSEGYSFLNTGNPIGIDGTRETRKNEGSINDVVNDFYATIGEKNPDSSDKVSPSESLLIEDLGTMGKINKDSESRTIKMIPDSNANDKLNKIKEELDRTKSVKVRRKSEEEAKNPAIKPFEVKPVANALQGLQFLLKMSKPSIEPTASIPLSTTAPSDKMTSVSEEKQKTVEMFKRSDSDKSLTRSYRRRSKSRSKSRDRKFREKDEERSRGRERPSSNDTSSNIRSSRDEHSSKRRNSSNNSSKRDSSRHSASSRRDEHSISRRDDHSSSRKDHHSSSIRNDYPKHRSSERRVSREEVKSSERQSDTLSVRKDEPRDIPSNSNSVDSKSRDRHSRKDDRSRHVSSKTDEQDRGRDSSSKKRDYSRERNRSRTNSPKKKVELEERFRHRRESEGSKTHKNGKKKTIDELMSATIFQPVKFVKKINRAAVVMDSKVEEESKLLATEMPSGEQVEYIPKNEYQEMPKKQEEEISSMKINREAVVMDSKVEEESKLLANKGKMENKLNTEKTEADKISNKIAKEKPSKKTKANSPSRKQQKTGEKSAPSDSKFRSAQMNSIRKTLTDLGPGQSKSKEERKKKESTSDPDEIKVLSYKMGRPKCDEHIRIVRKVSNTEDRPSSSARKRDASTSPDKSRKYVKRLVEKERIVRKVYAVEENIDGVSDIKKVIHEKSVKQTATETERPVTPVRQLSPESERKASLEQIKEELERVKTRVSHMNKKERGKKKEEVVQESPKDIIKEDSDDDDMASIMKDVQQMEEEVKDISQEVEEEGQREKKEKVKKKKKKKDKEKVKLKERRKEMKVKDDEKEQVKIRAQEKEGESENDASEKRKGLKESETPPLTSPTKTIEIDAKLAKKILSSILGSNIGKTLNDVIRKEVNKTDSAIEKIKEEMKKKGEKGKKSKHRDKEESDKKSKTSTERNEESISRKRKKVPKHDYEKQDLLEKDHKSRNDEFTEDNPTKRSRTHSPSRKKQKHRDKSPSRKKSKKVDSDVEKRGKKAKRKEKLKDAVLSKKKSKSSKKKDRKKKKSKRFKEKKEVSESDSDMDDSIDDYSDDDDKDNDKADKASLDTGASADPESVEEEQVQVAIKEERIIKQLPPSPSPSPVQEEFDLDIGVNDDDLDFLDKETKVVKENAEEELKSERVTESRSGTTSNVVTDSEEDEEDLRALLLTQIANPRPRSRSRAGSRSRITWTPPRRQRSEDKERSLEQYSQQYNFPRSFITYEEKQLYFPNLYSSTLVDLELSSDSDSSCNEDCDLEWEERRMTNWVTSRMNEPRFSKMMELMLHPRQAEYLARH